MTGPGAVFVPGTPISQGSMKGYMVNGHVNVTSANAKTMPWRADVAATMRRAVGTTILYPEGPVWLRLTFVMPRRAAEPKRVTPAHTRKPDCDKLTRAVFDALSGILYRDDSQVVTYTAVKRTAAIGEQPGAHIEWGTA